MRDNVKIKVGEKIIVYIEHGGVLYAATASIEVAETSVEKWGDEIRRHCQCFKVLDNFGYDEEYVKQHLNKLTKNCTQVSPLLALDGYENVYALRRHEGYLGITVVEGNSGLSVTSRIQGTFAAMAAIWHVEQYLPFTMDAVIVD